MTGPRIHRTLSPDRSVAFVDAIYRVIEGTGAITDARTLLAFHGIGDLLAAQRAACANPRSRKASPEHPV